MIKNAKGLNTNNPKCKKKQVQTNKRTLILYTHLTFLKWTETMYQIKNKRILISKEQKNRYKKEEGVETCRIRQKPSFIDNIVNGKKKF